jgi:cell division protein FtsI/penicillin-binding protein 2
VTTKLPNRRIRLLLAVFVVAFAAMFVRAAWLQGVRAQDLGRLAKSQHRATVVDPGGRGTIYDRQGIQLAIGRQATTVYANPRQIDDPEVVAAVVAQTLRLVPEKVERLLSDRSRGFVYVARKADPRRAKLLERQQIVGLGFAPEEQRIYPQGHVAAQVLGYAGTDNRGLSGLELALDPVLRGRPGREEVVRDPTGRSISVLSSTAAEEGQDV